MIRSWNGTVERKLSNCLVWAQTNYRTHIVGHHLRQLGQQSRQLGQERTIAKVSTVSTICKARLVWPRRLIGDGDNRLHMSR